MPLACGGRQRSPSPPNILSTASPSPRSFITTMAKQSKRYRTLLEGLDLKTPRELPEAVQLLSKFGNTKFDQSVEVAMSLGIDPRQADQMVRGSVVLPHGIGKTLRVVVFAKGDKAAEAEEAGADAVGAEDLAKRIKDGWLDFDVCIASPDMMG